MSFRQALKNYGILFLIVLAGAFLRFFNLDFQSLWLDEIHSVNEANPAHSFKELYASVLMADPHPPLYFVLLHFVFKIFGYTSFVLRSFSAVTGLAGILAVFLLGRELFSRKVGIYAAVLACVNFFHIYYSQEGRMYALLFLMTTLAFYFLIRFIKRPSWRSAAVYGLFAAGMIYCHFFALFTFCAQFFVLLLFVIYPYQVPRLRFFVYSALAGIVAMLLYLPTYEIFRKAASRTSIWIPMPALDVYTQTFADFFGGAEIVVILIALLSICAFTRMFAERTSLKSGIDPVKDRFVFAFVVLFSWMIITLLLPLIRTYTALPMLINRYFVNIVPAVIILAAIGLYSIRVAMARYLVLGTLVVFSLVDLFLVKNYYGTVAKTQFRELSEYIIERNSGKEPVVSSLGWYFPFFLQRDDVRLPIIDKSLKEYVHSLEDSSRLPEPFWYVDAHGRTLDLDERSQAYLSHRFNLAHSLQLNNGWLHHYEPLGESLDGTEIPAAHKDDVKFNIEGFTSDSTLVTVRGWAFFYGHPATHTKISVLLSDGSHYFSMPTGEVVRPDVTDYFKSAHDLQRSGFYASARTLALAPGTYTVALMLRNDSSAQYGYVMTDKTFEKH